jgi:hypothetical protein
LGPITIAGDETDANHIADFGIGMPGANGIVGTRSDAAPAIPAAATSSAEHFFDRRDPQARGGSISGIPLAPGHGDQAVGFGHAAFPSRHGDLTAVDLVG